MYNRESARRRAFAWKMDVIRMNIQQCHPAVAGDPIQLLNPDAGIRLLQQKEERGILRKSIGKFRIAAVTVGNPERENGIAAVRLWFERIRVERRGVVFYFEIMQPVEVVQH